MCVSVYMDVLVSCMNDHAFLPRTTWLRLKISKASHNEVCHCERHLLSSGSLGASAKMQYHAIWHSIIRHISPFPERDWWQSPYSRFNQIGYPGVFLRFFFIFFIPVKYLGLLQSWYLVMWWGGHSKEGAVFTGSAVEEKKLPTHHTRGSIVTFYSVTFFPGRSAG